MEGLGHVVIGTQGKEVHLFADVVDSAHDYHRYVPGSFELADNILTAPSGKHEVQQDEVNGAVVYQQSLCAGIGADSTVLCSCEQGPEHIVYIGIVLDY